MPNHITNNLYIKAESQEELEVILSTIKGEYEECGQTVETPIDFNKIYPEPANDPNYDWYHWRLENWGTKWNAYDASVVSVNGNCATITFLTAWSTPAQAMIHLSNMFPKAEFEVEYADEDFSYNCGTYKLIGGDAVDAKRFEGGSTEAARFACEVLGYCEDDIVFNEDGSWNWADED